MKVKPVLKNLEGEAVSVVCGDRPASPETTTIGANGDDADILWVTRPDEVVQEHAEKFTIREKPTLDAHRLLPSCRGCGGVDIFDPRRMTMWQQPVGACFELALKLGASVIYVEDPSPAVITAAEDYAAEFANKGISIRFSVVEESQSHNSMEDLDNG